MEVADKIVRVVVPNDGIMEEATNAYIVGGGPVLVVDPGSAAGTPTVLAALQEMGNPAVRDILLTHAHPDHAAGAAALRAATGAPVWLHPDDFPILGRMGFEVPVDHELSDGQTIEIDGRAFDALLTPGHAAGHVAFIERGTGVTLAGDMVHGVGTVGIFPPYGSVQAYLNSLQRMLDHGVTRLLPGHGPVIEDGPALLRRYIAHRLEREAQIVEVLEEGPTTVEAIVIRLYPDVLPQHRHAARATARAHLEKLMDEGRAAREGEGEEARYALLAGD